MPLFHKMNVVEVSAMEAFAWHERPGALERLLPPWERIRILRREGSVRDEGRVVLQVRRGPFHLRWVARHRDYVAGQQLCDEQESGPFAWWIHTHRFIPDGESRCVLDDYIEYDLPFGTLGLLAGGRMVGHYLERLFAFRHERVRNDLLRWHAFADREPLRIALTGASGLIGMELANFLRVCGHQVDPLVRRAPRCGSMEIRWNPQKGQIDAAALEGVDAVVHLAGENIAGRWTERKKDAIERSRVVGTQLLCQTLARLKRPPRVLISASAIGIYGNRDDEMLTEESAPGQGFMAGVCRQWEAATEPARLAGIRVVNLRLGLVLSARAGALPRMMRPYWFGLGGPVGSGKQWMSWIALEDLVGVIHFLLYAESLAGPVNAVAPHPARNQRFARTLGKVLHRPSGLRLPEEAVRIFLGEMGESLLLGSQQVVPARLQAAGFPYLYPNLEGALRFEMGRG